MMLENVKQDDDRADLALKHLDSYSPFIIKTNSACVSPVPRSRWFWTNIPPSRDSPEETQELLPWYGEEGKEVHPVTGAIRRDWVGDE